MLAEHGKGEGRRSFPPRVRLRARHRGAAAGPPRQTAHAPGRLGQVESPARVKRRPGLSKPARLQHAFAGYLHDIARAYPATRDKPVLLTIENAPWHQGPPRAEVLGAHPQLQLDRLPSYSLQLNLIERLWRVLRRRATHHRLCGSMPELRAALRARFCYFQTQRPKGLSLIHRPRKKKEAKLTRA